MKLQLFILGCILQSIYGSGEKAPYIASVQLDGRHLCGGSIINKVYYIKLVIYKIKYENYEYLIKL